MCPISLEEINETFLATFNLPWINMSPWRGLKYHPWVGLMRHGLFQLEGPRALEVN